MRPGLLASVLLGAIDNYRASTLHDRVGHRCRFRPTCSHYAEDALLTRALPVALILVVRRLLRCTARTPLGTVDRVPRPSPRWAARVAGVLLLSGLTTLLVAGTASALAPPKLFVHGSETTSGGCDAFVGGVPIGNLDADHPLQVHKNQRVVLTGLGPPGIRNLPSSLGLRSTTEAKIHFVANLATRSVSENGTGQRFQKSVNVDNYLKYGSGVYRVDMHSVAPGGWDCSATFWVEMHGSKLGAEVAVAVGAIGTVGMVASARGGGEPPVDETPPQSDEFGTYDPGVAPEVLERAEARRDRAANGLADGGTACLAGILFALIASTGAFAAAVPVGTGGNPRRVWVKGRPVLGFVSGLFAGIGTTVALQQFGVYPLTIASAVVAPLVTAVLGGLRGWRGTAWRVA